MRFVRHVEVHEEGLADRQVEAGDEEPSRFVLILEEER
jgi:hypothetical protein